MNIIRKVILNTALQLVVLHTIKIKAIKMTFSNILISVMGIAFIVMPSVAFSWSSDTSVNTPISLALGDQSSPAIVSDGTGGAIIAWGDGRNITDDDIYVQHVDATGAVQWADNGVAVCTAVGRQRGVNIISDEAGGTILAWEDRRSGSYQIYAQRIDSSGNSQWITDGLQVTNVEASKLGISSDGAGGVILVWEDSRSGELAVYSQRINAGGELQWTTGGLLVSSLSRLPSVISDGNGGAIVTWQDNRSLAYDVYAQRLNASGDSLWATGGVAVAADAVLYESARNIISDGAGGAIILFYESGFKAQKINSNGVTQWPAPIWLTNNITLTYGVRPVFISDDLGGAIVAWDEYSDFDSFNTQAIYTQGVDADGVVRWGAAGVLVGRRPYQTAGTLNSIIGDNAGGFIASWMITDSDFNSDIVAQHFNVEGLPQWAAEPVQISTNLSNQFVPVSVSDGDGGAIFVWPDQRNGDQYDLYAQRFAGDGSAFGLQTPSNVSPFDGERINTVPTLSASAFVDDSGLVTHVASQWSINNIANMTPEIPEYTISGDDSYFVYQLPFTFPFFERNVTSISVNNNGLIELLEADETNFEGGGYGTHWDGDHINNMDAIFAANDDLDMTLGHLLVYNGGDQVVIEWYGATYADSDTNGNVVANTMLFQVELHKDGRVVWNFSQLDFSAYDNDLYSGVYPNGGTEIDMSATSLVNLTVPASFEFNPVTRAVSASTYNWFVPQPVIYDSGEITDLVSHLVPDTAGLEDSVAYYWGVRYKGDNDEWSLWSTPTSFSVDILAPMVITPTEPASSATDVAINTVIQATFSEEMDSSTIDTSSFTLTGPGGSISGTVNYSATIASFTPVDDLAYNTEYNATITAAVTDVSGTSMASPYSWNFTTGTEADLTAPTTVSFFPARNAMDVGIDIGSVSVTFSEAINAATVNQNSFTLTGPDGTVAGTLSYDAATYTARFDPDALLAYSAAYTATITTEIQDIAGNALGLNDSWFFSTSDAPPPPPPQDTVLPGIISYTPDVSPVPASVGAVTVTFSEPIQNIDTTSFRVSSSEGTVPGIVQYDKTAMTAWFQPTSAFDFGTQYTIRISSSLIRDLADNYMELDFVRFFTTGADPVTSGCNPELGEEEACENFDYFTYGTGAVANTYGSSITGLLAEYAARRSVSFGAPLAEDSAPASSVFESQAIAIVNSTKFSLRSRSRRMELSEALAGAWSMGASKIDVSGVPPGTLIPMSIVMSGNFTGNGGTLLLRVNDFDDYRGLGSVSVVGSGSVWFDSDGKAHDPITYTQMIDPYGDKQDAANYVKDTGSGSNNIRLDFLYPAVPNNGIYVWFVAGVSSLLSSGETDFTATLEVNPPPGVTVSLASGQVFTGAVDTDGDGVSDAEDSSPNDASIASPVSATGTGSLTIDVSDNAGVTLSQVQVLDDDDLSLIQSGKPADQQFPDGLISFRINGIAPGGTVTVNLSFPTAFPDGAKYYKVNETGFYEFPGAVINGNTVTLTITDGGLGDNDDMANGVIVDPGGVAIPVVVNPVTTSPVTTSSSSNNSGLFGIGAFDPLMLLALFMWSVISLVYRRRG